MALPVTDTLIQLARTILPSDSWGTFSELAFRLAGESQKATAIPALALVASVSLLVVVGWLWTVTRLWRWFR